MSRFGFVSNLEIRISDFASIEPYSPSSPIPETLQVLHPLVSEQLESSSGKGEPSVHDKEIHHRTQSMQHRFWCWQNRLPSVGPNKLPQDTWGRVHMKYKERNP